MSLFASMPKFEPGDRVVYKHAWPTGPTSYVYRVIDRIGAAYFLQRVGTRTGQMVIPDDRGSITAFGQSLTGWSQPSPTSTNGREEKKP